MEATIGWTEGKPWEIAWGEFCWEGTDGSNDWVDGEETVGNSLGRVPWGRSKMEATRGWTEGKPWEIACRELRGEVAIRKRREGGRGETVGNSLGRAPVGRSDTEATRGWKEETVGNSLGRAPVGRRDAEATRGWTGGNRGN